MTEEHPFSRFVRTIARGPNLSRPLTEDEMAEAARMILSGEVRELQLGAFLAVLRVRTEDPGEAAGFVRVVKEEVIHKPTGAPEVDLDWQSYAGKKRQLPWFLLSALLLAQNGVKVFIHGTEGHTPGRVYTREALEALGLDAAQSMDDAARHIRERNFAYLPLANLVPRLDEILNLKPILGVRSPMNTFTRMLNPFDAPYSLQSVFHPNYGEIHRQASRLLGQPYMAVFKGEGGETERRPAKPVIVESLLDGENADEEWPAMLPGEVIKTDEDMDLSRLLKLWRGEDDDAAATAAVTGTAAIALRLLGRTDGIEDAEAQARALWENRAESPLDIKDAA
ncbi:MAG: glycosyl transferase [Rhodospirillaceae bacterium]|nr:glycosyl transferase [Rhodospirillaceae bacterium]|tara:strand:- start:152 stop:1165 length:1014 start_codon:yes stop_codon:yes gene_type:complete